MKKLTALLLASALMVCPLTSCHSSDNNTGSNTSASAAAKNNPEETMELIDVAKNIKKAENSLLCDMETEGKGVIGTHIISNSDALNLSSEESDFDYKPLIDDLSNYYADADKYTYLIYIKDGSVAFAAAASSETSDDCAFFGDNSDIDPSSCKTLTSIADALRNK